MVFLIGNDDAAHDVAMAGQEFRDAMHGHVRAVFERADQQRSGECIIH